MAVLQMAYNWYFSPIYGTSTTLKYAWETTPTMVTSRCGELRGSVVVTACWGEV